MYCTFSRK